MRVIKSNGHKNIYYSHRLQRDVYKILGSRQEGFAILDLVQNKVLVARGLHYHRDAVNWIKAQREYN